MKIFNIFLFILLLPFLLIWTLPQSILGFLLLFFNIFWVRKIKFENFSLIFYFHHSNPIMVGGISLGIFILGNQDLLKYDYVVKHELGHVKQSYILSWLYLLIVGIPSICWVIYYKNFRKQPNLNYYSFYTEKWANKLMNLNI